MRERERERERERDMQDSVLQVNLDWFQKSWLRTEGYVVAWAGLVSRMFLSRPTIVFMMGLN